MNDKRDLEQSARKAASVGCAIAGAGCVLVIAAPLILFMVWTFLVILSGGK